MDTMDAPIPVWKLVQDLMTRMIDLMAKMNDQIQTINLTGIFLSFAVLFLFFCILFIYAKLDDRISKLEGANVQADDSA